MNPAYEDRAAQLAAHYEKTAFEVVHRAWAEHLPTAPGRALDVGAGSGRDAAALAARGWEVVAAEPSAGMRAEGQRLHPDAGLTWVDAGLPGLERVEGAFDLVLLSAVWMHVPADDRAAAFDRLVQLLKPGGLLVVVVRYGPSLDGRTFFEVPPEELPTFAQRYALEVVANLKTPDRLGRPELHWRTVVLRAADDPEGGLKLLRQVIVHDAKSSTYKLALLRSVLRIADGQRGLVSRLGRAAGDDALVPMGAVALNWLRQYRPLLFGERQYRQGSRPSAMRRPAFEALQTFAPEELHVGATFVGERARQLWALLRASRALILKMPATYLTAGPDHAPVFRPEGRPGRFTGDRLVLDPATLTRLGRLRVPGGLWRAMVRHAAWIEPALTLEWARVMRRYDELAADRGFAGKLEGYLDALAWEDKGRSTAQVRRLASTLRGSVFCVWTGKRLKGAFDIDHCVPYARWPNNDLWNLLPSAASANRAKSDRLPTAATLRAAEPRIIDWWARAYQADPAGRGRFRAEAAAALPRVGEARDNQVVFAGLTALRHRLRVEHQLAEWAP